MNTPIDELNKILGNKDEGSITRGVEQFFRKYGDKLPLPGANKAFDRAIWAASQYMELSTADKNIVQRVTERLLDGNRTVTALKIRDLVGAAREAAVTTWQEMLAAMAWQQMVPAGSLRGVGAQMVSLGTFQQDIADINIQINLGWLVEEDQFRILLNAKDKNGAAVPDIELKVKEADNGVVFSRKTNQDGAVVAPSVKVGPGQYQIEVLIGDKVAQTPFFVL